MQVSCYKAAQLAGVSKQAISDMKKKNDKSWGRYPFFVIDPIARKVKVDTEHPAWSDYLIRNGDQKVKPKQTEIRPTPSVQNNYPTVTDALNLMAGLIEKKFGQKESAWLKMTFAKEVKDERARRSAK